MNKEEIDSLETYLKDKLPKIEPTIPIPTFESVNLEDLMDSIRQFKKVPTSDELLRENKKLRNQLEEKDKVIDKVVSRLKLLGAYDGKSCTRNFKMMSADFNQLIYWLERGRLK